MSATIVAGVPADLIYKNVSMVKVRFAAHNGNAEALLEVSDNGPGMGDARSGSMGLRLIETLSSQLSGRLEIDSSSKGTTVSMYFPLVE